MRGFANPDGLFLDERHPQMAMKRTALDGVKYFLRPRRKSPRSLARVTKRGDKEEEEEEERNNYVRVVRSPDIGKKFTRVTKRGDDEGKEKERKNYFHVMKSLGKKFSRAMKENENHAVGGLLVHSWKNAQTLQMRVCVFFSFVVLICGLWMFLFLLDLCKIFDKEVIVPFDSAKDSWRKKILSLTF